ncbi:hypothetical protein K1W63_02615 [Weissella cibaria]|nr:hypothetical protein [Weissella cibaria]
MSKQFKIITAVLIVIVVAIGGGVWYGISHNPKNLTAEQFAQLPIEEQFDKAPAGHYIHLGKNDSTLYKTTWSKAKIKNYIVYKYGHMTTNDEGTTHAKTSLGTGFIFDDSILMDSKKGNGVIGQIFANLMDNNNFTDTISYNPDTSFHWYFDDLKSAKADKDVSGYVTKIVR